MGTLIKNIRSRNIIEYDKGLFDNWCVYVKKFAQARYAPRDVEYFSRLKQIGQVHGHHKIYNDFVSYYTHTTDQINLNILNYITQISATYGTDEEEMDVWFTVIYAGMVAEENKAGAILKKRIKRLGMHQVLTEGHTPEFAAYFSKGKKWRELDAIMKLRGF